MTTNTTHSAHAIVRRVHKYGMESAGSVKRGQCEPRAYSTAESVRGLCAVYSVLCAVTVCAVNCVCAATVGCDWVLCAVIVCCELYAVCCDCRL